MYYSENAEKQSLNSDRLIAGAQAVRGARAQVRARTQTIPGAGAGQGAQAILRSRGQACSISSPKTSS